MAGSENLDAKHENIVEVYNHYLQIFTTMIQSADLPLKAEWLNLSRSFVAIALEARYWRLKASEEGGLEYLFYTVASANGLHLYESKICKLNWRNGLPSLKKILKEDFFHVKNEMEAGRSFHLIKDTWRSSWNYLLISILSDETDASTTEAHKTYCQKRLYLDFNQFMNDVRNHWPYGNNHQPFAD